MVWGGSQPGRGGPCNAQPGFVGMMGKCSRVFSWFFFPCHLMSLGCLVSLVTHVVTRSGTALSLHLFLMALFCGLTPLSYLASAQDPSTT